MPNHPAGTCDDLALTWKYVSSHNQTGSQEQVRTPKQSRPSYAVLSANRMIVGMMMIMVMRVVIIVMIRMRKLCVLT